MMISNSNYDADHRFWAQTLTCSRSGPEAVMDGDRFIVAAKGNPRTVGFGGSAASKPVPNEISRKPSVPIVDRFKSMLKRRADDLRVLSGGDVPPPTTEEIVRLYVTLLSELILNSKPIISGLTIIAGDYKEHAVGIADAICARIMEVPFDQKLPSLYLLDSIVKNIGQDYISHFSSRLHEVFCEAYRQAQPSSYNAMQHLFGTWSAVFPPSVLRKIEAQLQFSPAVDSQSLGITSLRDSESPRPSHGVHVNPKCLEEKHKFDPSPVDNNMQHMQGTSSTAKVPGQKSAIGYDECSSGYVEVISSQATDQRLNSTSSVGHAPFALGTDKVIPSSTARVAKPASPTSGAAGTSSPPAEKLLMDNSPRRAVERASPSHRGFEHRLVRSVGRDEETSDSQRKPWSNDMSETSAASNLINEYKRQGLRALIDEYGSDRGQRLGNDKPPKFGHLDMNGAGNKIPKKAWQNTEEEEYDWEDMNPTLANCRQSNNVLPSSTPPFGSFNTRPCSGPLESDLNRSKWSTATKTISPHTSNLPDVDVQLRRFPTGASRMGLSNVNSISMDVQSAGAPMSSGMWPYRNMPKTHTLPSIPNLPQSKQPGYQFNLMNSCTTTVANEDPNKSLFLPELNRKLPQMPSHLTGSIPSNRPNQTAVPPLNPRCNPQEHTAATSAILINPVPAVHSSTPTYNISNNNVHFQGRALPPLAPVPPPNHQPRNALSGLISSLIAQGLITLPKQPTIQDSVGVDFNVDVLKLRHESAISALYGDMSRQCATCGLRFKCQKEHRNHMDWHVIKNRVSKNCKGGKRSRGWFASASMWLSSADASGTGPVPGVLLSQSIVEKKDDEEPVVPADEEQTVCALCREHFDDYYSHETDEWMYRGAVYLDAPVGSITGMDVDRTQLGPIVHAKCRSEPKGNMEEEEGGRRKRMRLS